MDEIRFGQDYRVIVDYAHTDDSYNKLLHYVRHDLPGIKRIITVSGAPGKEMRATGRFSDTTSANTATIPS